MRLHATTGPPNRPRTHLRPGQKKSRTLRQMLMAHPPWLTLLNWATALSAVGTVLVLLALSAINTALFAGVVTITAGVLLWALARSLREMRYWHDARKVLRRSQMWLTGVAKSVEFQHWLLDAHRAESAMGELPGTRHVRITPPQQLAALAVYYTRHRWPPRWLLGDAPALLGNLRALTTHP